MVRIIIQHMIGETLSSENGHYLVPRDLPTTSVLLYYLGIEYQRTASRTTDKMIP